METVRWCEGGGDARKDSEKRGWRIDHDTKLREGGKFRVRGEKGRDVSQEGNLYETENSSPGCNCYKLKAPSSQRLPQ